MLFLCHFLDYVIRIDVLFIYLLSIYILFSNAISSIKTMSKIPTTFLLSLIFILSYVSFIKAQTYSINTTSTTSFEDISQHPDAMTSDFNTVTILNKILPIDINIYGNNYAAGQSISISKHGAIFLDVVPSAQNRTMDLPAYDSVSQKYYNAIFPFWQENISNNSNISILVKGNSPRKQYIIQ